MLAGELMEMLDDEQMLLLEKATTVGKDEKGAFRKTWALRLLTRPLAWTASAVGEIEHRVRKGDRFKIGPGEAMNDIFCRLRDVSRMAGTKR